MEEPKEINQVKEYQKLLPFPARDREKFERLSKYLTADIAGKLIGSPEGPAVIHDR